VIVAADVRRFTQHLKAEIEKVETRNESRASLKRVSRPDEAVCCRHDPVVYQVAQDARRSPGPRQTTAAVRNFGGRAHPGGLAGAFCREFVSKLGGALQEADESQLWLELLREECGITPADTLAMEKEANELMAIMNTMINNTKDKADNRK